MNEIIEVDRLALVFATAAHGAIGQRRKYTNEPYINHPIAVADIVRTVSDDPEMLAAAYLHDVVEDTPTTIEQVRHNFGDRVADLVADLTDISRPADGNRETRRAIDRAHSAAASADAQTIKVADLIDNSRSIAVHDKAFARVYMREKRLLLDALTMADARLLTIAETLVRDYEQSLLDRALR